MFKRNWFTNTTAIDDSLVKFVNLIFALSTAAEKIIIIITGNWFVVFSILRRET